jgi:hypothetical protein
VLDPDVVGRGGVLDELLTGFPERGPSSSFATIFFLRDQPVGRPWRPVGFVPFVCERARGTRRPPFAGVDPDCTASLECRAHVLGAPELFFEGPGCRPLGPLLSHVPCSVLPSSDRRGLVGPAFELGAVLRSCLRELASLTVGTGDRCRARCSSCEWEITVYLI